MGWQPGETLSIPRDQLVSVYSIEDEPESTRIDTALIDRGSGPYQLVSFYPDTWEVVESMELMCSAEWVIEAMEEAQERRESEE
jgi:hypothetical protein